MQSSEEGSIRFLWMFAQSIEAFFMLQRSDADFPEQESIQVTVALNIIACLTNHGGFILVVQIC